MHGGPGGGKNVKMYGRSGPSDKKGNAALCATQPLLAEGIYLNMLSHSALLASALSARCKDLKNQVQIILWTGHVALLMI